MKVKGIAFIEKKEKIIEHFGKNIWEKFLKKVSEKNRV